MSPLVAQLLGIVLTLGGSGMVFYLIARKYGKYDNSILAYLFLITIAVIGLVLVTGGEYLLCCFVP